MKNRSSRAVKNNTITPYDVAHEIFHFHSPIRSTKCLTIKFNGQDKSTYEPFDTETVFVVAAHCCAIVGPTTATPLYVARRLRVILY